MAIEKKNLNRQSDLILTGAVITAPVGISRDDIGLSNVDNTSDLNKPVSIATSAAIAAAVVGLYDDRGNYNPNSSLVLSRIEVGHGSGRLGEIRRGDVWTVSENGFIEGIQVSVGDLIRALVDNPSNIFYSGNDQWQINSNNFGYVVENAANKVTSLSNISTDTQYASAKTILDQLQLKVNANSTIISDTLSKITFNPSGLVTGAVDATTADIAPSVDRNYVTDAQVVLGEMYFRAAVLQGR